MVNSKNNDFCITIIIPSYNNACFISQAIETILRQPCCDQIQIVVIDDGSIDSTSDVCSQYASLSNFCYIRTENFGAGHARNIGIENAKGDWIIFLDSDDLIVSSVFDGHLLKKLQAYRKKDVDIIYCSCVHSNIELTSIPKVMSASENRESLIPKESFWANIYRASFLQNNLNCRFYEYRQQDIETAFRYIVKKESRKFCVDNKICFYIHRDNPNGNINTINEELLYGVKTLVYYDLFLRYGDRDILKEAVRLCYKYYKKVITNGYYSEPYLWEGVNTIFKQQTSGIKKLWSKYLVVSISYTFCC